MSDQIQCNGGQIKHNSNQIQLDPDAPAPVLEQVDFTGTMMPPIGGRYTENGTYNSKKAYQHGTNSYWIWWRNPSWVCSEIKGTSTDSFVGMSAALENDYYGVNGFSGSGIIERVPPPV